MGWGVPEAGRQCYNSPMNSDLSGRRTTTRTTTTRPRMPFLGRTLDRGPTMKPILPIAIICWSQMVLTGVAFVPLPSRSINWSMANINLSVILDGLTWVAPLPLPLHSNKHVSSLDCKLGQKKFVYRKTHQCLIATIACWYPHACECDRNAFKHP